MRADGLYTQTLQIPNLIKSSLKEMLALREGGGGLGNHCSLVLM